MKSQKTTHTQQMSSVHDILQPSQSKFAESILDFEKEQIFATQLLMNNSYLLGVAQKNPSSVKLAMYNVAAVGLTLNPALHLCYLVPRRLIKGQDAQVLLDISYRGLISIGVRTGAISWAKAELVFEQDKFVYNGPTEKPSHQLDPFSKNRGEVIGGYCIAGLPSGDVLVDAMSRQDMDKIRNSSEAFKKGFGPWVEWQDQMQLKSIVKRASKWWPKSSEQMATALQILNDENGEGITTIHSKTEVQSTGQVVTLMPPPKAHEVPTDVQDWIQRFVNRALEKSAYAACEEAFRTRIRDPQHLSYALNELRQAKETAVANS